MSENAEVATSEVILMAAGNLWGLQERITAARSLLALAQELQAARKAMQKLLSQGQVAALETFYTRTVEASGMPNCLVDCIRYSLFYDSARMRHAARIRPPASRRLTRTQMNQCASHARHQAETTCKRALYTDAAIVDKQSHTVGCDRALQEMWWSA